MRRFVPASTQRLGKVRKPRALRAVVEGMEPRTLFAATAPTVPPAGVFIDTFPLSSTDGFIQGTVFEDTNSNHIFDAQDVPLSGAEVFIEVLNGNGAIVNEEAATTDLTGSYDLEVPAGTYTVQADSLVGLLLDPLSTGVPPITITNSQTITGKDFAFEAPASVSGNVFADVNHNGTRDAGEVGIPNRNVYVDVNNDGVFDTGDIEGTTDTSGNYTLGLPSAGTFTIRMEVPPGSTLTSPPSGGNQITVAEGQQASGADFGLTGPDLTAALVKTPPASVIGGQKQKPVEVLVTNVGSSNFQGLVGVSLFVSTDTILDGPPTDPQVGLLIGKKLKLKVGKSKIIKVPFTVPAAVASGPYHLLAQVISSPSDENPANDVAAAAAITNVLQPIVDFNVTYTQQPLPHFDYGAGGFVAVTLTNNGDVAYDGTVDFQVFASTDGTLDGATLLSHQPVKKVKVLAHHSRVIVVPINFTGLSKGNFFLITTVDPVAPIADVNQTNNTVVSTNQTLIL